MEKSWEKLGKHGRIMAMFENSGYVCNICNRFYCRPSRKSHQPLLGYSSFENILTALRTMYLKSKTIQKYIYTEI